MKAGRRRGRGAYAYFEQAVTVDEEVARLDVAAQTSTRTVAYNMYINKYERMSRFTSCALVCVCLLIISCVFVCVCRCGERVNGCSQTRRRRNTS